MLYENGYSFKTNANKRHLLPFLTHQNHFVEKMHLSGYQYSDEPIKFHQYYYNSGFDRAADALNARSFTNCCESSSATDPYHRSGYQWTRIEQSEESSKNQEFGCFPYRIMENVQEMRENFSSIGQNVFKNNQLNSAADDCLRSERTSGPIISEGDISLSHNDSVDSQNDILHGCLSQNGYEAIRHQDLRNIPNGFKEHGK